MKIDVTFQQTDMAIQPRFFTDIQVGSGVVFVPDVSEDGVISWTNNGNLPNPEPVVIRGKDGVDGQPGKDGADGKPGADGYTPVKGTDYWTEADRTQMVADVINALPVYNGEVVS